MRLNVTRTHGKYIIVLTVIYHLMMIYDEKISSSPVSISLSLHPFITFIYCLSFSHEIVSEYA